MNEYILFKSKFIWSLQVFYLLLLWLSAIKHYQLQTHLLSDQERLLLGTEEGLYLIELPKDSKCFLAKSLL